MLKVTLTLEDEEGHKWNATSYALDIHIEDAIDTMLELYRCLRCQKQLDKLGELEQETSW